MATVENPCATRVSPKTKTGTKGKSPEDEAVPGFTIKSRMKHVKVFSLAFSCFTLVYSYYSIGLLLNVRSLF